MNESMRVGRLHFGECVRVRIMGREVRAEVLAVTRDIVSIRVLRADRQCLVGSTWAIKIGALCRVVESGELFQREVAVKGGP